MVILSIMSGKDIFENLRTILDAIRNTVEKGNAEIGQNNPTTGWQYLGPEISSQTSKLEEEVNKTEFKVCSLNLCLCHTNVQSRLSRQRCFTLFQVAFFITPRAICTYFRLREMRVSNPTIRYAHVIISRIQKK